MYEVIYLTALYPEMEEATIGAWSVGVGNEVAVDEALVELITDKVAFTYASPAAGTVLAILPAEKSVVPVGTALAVLGEAGAEVGELAALLAENRRLSEEREALLNALHEATGIAEEAPPPRMAGPVRATPAARRLARERGVDLTGVAGTGPEGMITADDVP